MPFKWPPILLLFLVASFNANAPFQSTHHKIVPQFYKLVVSHDPLFLSNKGIVFITMKVSTPCKSIKLHSSGLQFKSIEFSQEHDRKKLEVDSVIFDKLKETAEIPVSVKKGYAKLKIVFYGKSNYNGFQFSTGNVSRLSFSTQFNQTGARRVFPCLDEPWAKAKFAITIVVPKTFKSVSIAPIIEETHLSGTKKRVRFETTLPISPSEIIWLSGEWVGTTRKTKSGTIVTTMTDEENSVKAKRVQFVAYKTMNFLEWYFNSRYPLGRYEVVLFNSFRESLRDDFGLLVMKGSENRFKEEFGKEKKLVSFFVDRFSSGWLEDINPKCKEKDFQTDAFLNFLGGIAIRKILNISKNDISAVKEKEISFRASEKCNDLNESINCNGIERKTAFFRMAESVLGADAFRNGVNSYLLRKSILTQNCQIDFWSSFYGERGNELKKIIKSFTENNGYPIINAKTYINNCSKWVLRFKQSPFPENTNSVWRFLLLIGTNETKKWTRMRHLSGSVELEEKYNSSYPILNIESSGYFRINVLIKMMRQLAKEIRDGKISKADRYSVLSDVLSLLKNTEKKSSESLLNLIQSYKKESSSEIWVVILEALDLVYDIVRENNNEPAFCTFYLSMTKKIIQKIGKYTLNNGKNKDERELRKQILHQTFLCRDGDLINFLNILFRSHTCYKNEFDLVLFGIVMANFVRENGEGSIETVKEFALEMADQGKISESYGALGYFDDENLLKESLGLVLGENIERINSLRVFSSVYRNPKGVKIAWEFFKMNYTKLQERYLPLKKFPVLLEIVQHLNSFELLEDAKEFFKETEEEKYQKDLKKMFMITEKRLKLKTRELENVQKWFDTKT